MLPDCRVLLGLAALALLPATDSLCKGCQRRPVKLDLLSDGTMAFVAAPEQQGCQQNMTSTEAGPERWVWRCGGRCPGGGRGTRAEECLAVTTRPRTLEFPLVVASAESDKSVRKR